MSIKKNWHLYVATLAIFILLIGGIVILKTELCCKAIGTISSDNLIEIPKDKIPADAFYVSGDRMNYKAGEIRLVIPKISVDTLIGASTEEKELEKNPGLYEIAQMPWENGNVSIAGHRDIYGKEFYSLDKLTEGDTIYLVYNETVFIYKYVSDKIIRPDDWSVIANQGFSAVTLTTCDPIGSTANRLIVTGELLETIEYSASFSFT